MSASKDITYVGLNVHKSRRMPLSDEEDGHHLEGCQLLLLCERAVLREPMLYLSLFFKTHRQTYYDLLNRVRIDGDWEAWLDYFAEAVTVTAGQAVDTVQRLEAMARRDRERIRELGRATGSSSQLHHELLLRPISSSPELSRRTGLTPLTVNRALARLVEQGIVRERTGQKRNRVFAHSDYLAILNEGTELTAAEAE